MGATPAHTSSRSAESRFTTPYTSVPMVCLVDADGNTVTDPDVTPRLDAAQMAEALEQMARIRRFDVESTALQRKGQLGLWVPLLGQEAVQVGVAMALSAHDHVFPTHREHGIGSLMGIPIERILGVFKGAEMSKWDAESTRFHHYNMVIGAHTLHAVGYAMGQLFDRDRGIGDDGVSVVFHGDGAISEGDVNEAYAFAAMYQAPVVFMCVNNQWAISEPVHRQTTMPLYQRAWGFGIPSLQVDGNDVQAVHAVTSEAIERARAGEGPQMIEAFTCRMGAHTTSDDPTKYRFESLEAWQAKDPIARVQTWLRATGAWDDERQAALDHSLDDYGEQVRQAVNDARVNPREVFENVYTRTPADLEAQYEELEEWL